MDKYQKYDPRIWKCQVTCCWQHGCHKEIEYKYSVYFRRDLCTKKVIEIVEVHGSSTWQWEKLIELTENFKQDGRTRWYSN